MDYSTYEFQALPQRERRGHNMENSKTKEEKDKELEIELATMNAKKESEQSSINEIEADYPVVPIPENCEFSEERPIEYEYLDNTADIQVHSWGKNLKLAFEQNVLGMFGYMTDMDKIKIDLTKSPKRVKAHGHDLLSLLYQLLDECLCLFSTEYFLVRDIHILEFNEQTFDITALCFGEEWNTEKHPQGTEIKAVTYSNMQIHERDDHVDVYVILDI
ncbi:hypothetical protein WA158_003759 [Blastocystis sp. Blastoise]